MAAIIPAASADNTTTGAGISFRWTFIALPVVVIVLSVILVAIFYRLLPPEAAYRFDGGSPSAWLGRGRLIAWMLAPQFVFFLFALGIAALATMLSARYVMSGVRALHNIITLMGNIVALPQVVLFFAMLDIFLYNAYQVHLMPVWAFALIIMVLGSAVVVIVFVKSLRQLRGPSGTNLRERK